MQFNEALADEPVLRTLEIIDGGRTLTTSEAEHQAARDWYVRLRN